MIASIFFMGFSAGLVCFSDVSNRGGSVNSNFFHPAVHLRRNAARPRLPPDFNLKNADQPRMDRDGHGNQAFAENQ
jgi:hypothetical protein